MTTKQLGGLVAITLDEIHPSPNNPREHLTGIDELAQSMHEIGLIQPLVVQRIPGQDGYQIVAGHRRYAAAQKIRMASVPCIVRRDMLPDEELLAMLVENGQRANLDPIEEARALNTLKQQGMTDVEIGRKIGRSNGHVWSRLQLLKLPIEEQEELRTGRITIGAAVEKAKVDSGSVYKPRKGREMGIAHLGSTHELAAKARARCSRLNHKSKGPKSVGGVACGECWESVIRADERAHIHTVSVQQGTCGTCGHAISVEPAGVGA